MSAASQYLGVAALVLTGVPLVVGFGVAMRAGLAAVVVPRTARRLAGVAFAGVYTAILHVVLFGFVTYSVSRFAGLVHPALEWISMFCLLATWAAVLTASKRQRLLALARRLLGAGLGRAFDEPESSSAAVVGLRALGVYYGGLATLVFWFGALALGS